MHLVCLHCNNICSGQDGRVQLCWTKNKQYCSSELPTLVYINPSRKFSLYVPLTMSTVLGRQNGNRLGRGIWLLSGCCTACNPRQQGSTVAQAYIALRWRPKKPYTPMPLENMRTYCYLKCAECNLDCVRQNLTYNGFLRVAHDGVLSGRMSDGEMLDDKSCSKVDLQRYPLGSPKR